MGGARQAHFWDLVSTRVELYLAQLAASPSAGAAQLAAPTPIPNPTLILTLTLSLTSCAMASRCSTQFVLPPHAYSTATAFSSARAVTIC